MRSEFRSAPRLFIAEYDFRAYFENISHEHLRRVLRDHFLTTPVERSAVDGFLTVSAANSASYAPAGGDVRDRGIPQGTSISLFLANVAAWELDRALEREGVGFARYADDTLIWSSDYSAICRAAEQLHEHASGIGVSINAEKSPGVRLLVEPGAHAEFSATTDVEYLGYAIGLGHARPKDAALQRMKERVQNLAYWTLLSEPQAGTFNPSRLSPIVDRDYVVFIWRLRRWLYGDLSEAALRRYQSRGAPLRRFKGVMSAYPLADDTEDLRRLDGWIASHVHMAMARRSELLVAAGLSTPPPHGLSTADLIRFVGRSATTKQPIDLRLPSVRRIATVIRAAAATHGASAIGRASPYGY